MTWNYRVVESKNKHDETFFEIKEIYYDEYDNMKMFSVDGMKPGGETIKELKLDLRWMLKALSKPILKQSDLDLLFTKNTEEEDLAIFNKVIDEISKEDDNVMDNFID